MSCDRGGMPVDESRRLAAVRRYRILDTPPEGAFDRVCALAARFCDVPIATVTIVDEDRVWMKACQGVGAVETAREPGLCASAILSDEPYVVPDAAADPATSDNPLVRGELGLRFYAAAPIVTHDGYRIGTVNVIDTRPREIGATELATLQDLAGIVTDELELRLSSLRAIGHERERCKRVDRDRSHLGEVVETLRRGLLPARLPRVPGMEIASYYHPASPDDIGGDFYDVFPAGTGNRWNVVLGDVCGMGPAAAALTSFARYTLRTATVLSGDPVAGLFALNEAILREGESWGGSRFCTAVCAQVDPTETGSRLRLADGGHPPVLVLRRDGTVEPVKSGGMLVGCVPDAQFSAVELDLGPGDWVLLYTDGITDVRTPDSTFFGTEGLTGALSGYSYNSANEVVTALRKVIADFDSPPADDVALLVFGPGAGRGVVDV